MAVRRRGLVLALLCAALILSCNKESPRVSVGIAIGSYVHAVAWVAAERGHFDKAAVSAEVSVMGGSAATMRTLIAEQIDVGLAGGDAAIKANAAGADLVIIGGLVNRFYHRLVVRNGIEDAAGLQGKRIGLPFLGGPQDMAVKVALGKLGLDYDKDVQVVSLGKEFNRMAALQSGEIDATTSQSPPSKLAELGASVLVDLPAASDPFPYIAVVVRRAWLAKHRVQARAVLQAICEATQDYRGHQDPTLALIGKHLGNADVDGAARERYQQSGPSLLSYPPKIDTDAIKAVQAMLGDEQTIASLTDATVLDEVIAQGHCQ